ncbi:helix-turn-helix domain-containing protein [Nocardiopsis sp. RSe5-2]|uniref:Helix-turn-helix domain-containing protein n=1 Tax=Nocardiopsis endophytica TaxID=3018445 RepID=A0ABT4U0A0_9ACTN|nr:helix-turn-helix domain-containing protein [Nocardiopsis endophytica]MDA2810373.1 helix-turn-helix domain-containing protein [Nocardiopsis endophytica]
MSTATRHKQLSKAGDFEALWTIEQVSAFLGLPKKTLYQWRHKGYGPRSHRVGKHVRYFPEEVRSWVEAQG